MRFVLGVPAYRGLVCTGHITQALALGAACLAKRVALDDIITVDSCFVDHARNVILHRALAKDTDWILMLDADTYCTEPFKLLAMMEENPDYAVVAAPVQRRRTATFNVPGVEPDSWHNKTLDVERVGTACMAVNARWLKRHWPDQPWFQAVQLPGNEPSVRSEDFSFCDGVRSRNGRILLDGRLQVRHEA